MFGRREYNKYLPFSSNTHEEDEDISAGPPSLGDIGDLTLYKDNNDDDDGGDGDEAEKFNKNISKLEYEAGDSYDDEAEGHTTAAAPPDSIVLPTKLLSTVILVLLLLTHLLLGHECIHASKSLKKKEKGELAEHSFTTYVASPGMFINVRSTYSTTSKLIASFSASDSTDMEFEVFGQPYTTNSGTKRIHIISPVNGWATEVTSGGKRYMDRIYNDEDFMEVDEDDMWEEEDALGELNDDDIPFCPIFDAGYYKTYLSRYQYARSLLVLSQQFWNATQVFHLILLVALYSIMASTSSYHLSTPSIQSYSQLLSEKKKKTILWCFFILFTVFTVILLPFSVYVTSPGGHISAILMTLTSLATFYTSPPNVCFTLANLPPQCCTPRRHPGAALQQDEHDNDWDCSLSDIGSPPSSSNTFTATDMNDVVIISGKGLCKVELIAFLCNLGSSLYHYSTAKEHVFPNWNKLFHNMDKWFGLTGGNAKLYREIPGRFMYNMGFKSYHQPLYTPLSFGSTTGSYVFLFIWSILPFLYVCFFMSMYILAKRAPGVKIQQCLALFGVFHFLFITDVVSYKYGRGLRNEASEYCHWIERFAWSIAILLPIYQNVVSKYYIQHAQRHKYIGPVLHYFMAAWGISFLIYQVFMNDVVHVSQFLMGKTTQTELFGWSYSYKLGYIGSLSVMVFVYGFMAFGGTWCHHVYAGP